MPLSIKDDLPDIIPTYLSGIFIARPQKTIVGTKGYNLYSEIEKRSAPIDPFVL